MGILVKIFLSWSCLYTNVVPTTNFLVKQFATSEETNVKDGDNQKVEYKYNSFLTDDKIKSTNITENWLMYSGRILKYYYANYITGLTQNIVGEIQEILTVKKEESPTESDTQEDKTSKLEKIEFYRSLFIQNLIGSTLNISIYGASSDNEFFAEAFSKWLQTPRELMNKSWYITNNFFCNVLPMLMKNGDTLQNKTKTIINWINGQNKSNEYDISLKSPLSNTIDLHYQNSNIGWKSSVNGVNYFDQSISKIIQQCKIFELKEDSKSKLRYLLNDWMNDSFTPAPDISIALFESFNSQHFGDFKSLDSYLQNRTIDEAGYSTVWFSNILSFLKKDYAHNSKLGDDYFDWTDQKKASFESIVTQLFNYLYSIISNDEGLSNLISAFVVAGDEKLVGDKSDGLVAGYTSTSFVRMSNNKYSVKSSYIVILANALTIKDYNSEYLSGFWSAPDEMHVLVHEFGHALDGYGGKDDYYRRTSEANSSYYPDYYEGKYVGGYDSVKVSDLELYSTYAIAAIALFATLCFLYGSNRIKKARK
ncbi:hypothetical protein STABA_v1c05070 [Spiroplasma tabanidicola]|uniref:Uncharacterized protein n=2 Tax=Spiroplasma tabanidicola TaxID=324079 RepID=A0A6I6C6Q2_9MOLU|nr:hypothetical protein STABA_v1c05070 [Spiroplasma tabanidicola]